MSKSKIQKSTLYDLVPNGNVVTRQWLLSKGLGSHTIDNLIKSGQLLSVARGVYQRPGYDLEWQGVAASLERMGSSLLVGGLTALEVNGYGHYITLGNRSRVHLYGRESAPNWLNKLINEVTFVPHNTARLFSVDMPMQKLGFLSTHKPVCTTYSVEAAYLQVLMDVPHAISFEYADKLMEGLTTLSPKGLNELLHHCISVKVKRLFFWFSERHNHAWLAKLNSNDYGLGSGKRSLAPGGKLDTRFNITVPEELHGPAQPIY